MLVYHSGLYLYVMCLALPTGHSGDINHDNYVRQNPHVNAM